MLCLSLSDLIQRLCVGVIWRHYLFCDWPKQINKSSNGEQGSALTSRPQMKGGFEFHIIKKNNNNLGQDVMQGTTVHFYNEEFKSKSVKRHSVLLPDTSEWLN